MPPVVPAATVSAGTIGSTGGRFNGSTVIGTVIVAVKGAAPVVEALTARKDTAVSPALPNIGVQVNSSVPGSKLAPGGSAPTTETVTVPGSLPWSISVPSAARTDGMKFGLFGS